MRGVVRGVRAVNSSAKAVAKVNASLFSRNISKVALPTVAKASILKSTSTVSPAPRKLI